MTEIYVPCNTRSTTKVERDGSGSFRYTKIFIYEIPSTKTISYGLESIRYLDPKILKLMPDELKESKSRTFQAESEKFEI